MQSSVISRVFLAFNFLFSLFGLVLMCLGLFAEFDSGFVHRLVTFVDGIEEAAESAVASASASASASHASTSTPNDSAPTTESPFHAVATYVRLMSHGVIALGAAIGFVAFTGCCGAWRQSKRCLSLFFTLLMLCLLLTLLLGGALFFAAVASSTQKESGGVSPSAAAAAAGGGSGAKLDPVMAKIASGFKSLVEAAWNALTQQQRFSFERANSCCSLYDAEDLLGVLSRADCGSDMASKGCYDKVVSAIERNFAIFGGAMLLLAAVEITAMTLSCIIFQKIRQTYAAV